MIRVPLTVVAFSAVGLAMRGSMPMTARMTMMMRPALRCLHAHARLGQLTPKKPLRLFLGEPTAANACMAASAKRL